jgi:hypothetical protein
MAKKCLRFAYSFTSFMQRQYYWSCGTPPVGKAQRIQKNLQKLLIGAANSPRFAIGMAKAPCFAF